MYTEKVMDHFQNPRNVGEIENASGVGTVGNAKCGDIMRIYLDIDENQIIRDVKFKTFGCGAAVATSSMATELVKGKNIQEAMQVTNKAVMILWRFSTYHLVMIVGAAVFVLAKRYYDRKKLKEDEIGIQNEEVL